MADEKKGKGGATAIVHSASAPAVVGEAQGTTAGNGSKLKETKIQRFNRLAERRVNNALHALRRLIPLANRSQYEYGEGEVTAIRDALTSAMADIQRAFAGQKQESTVFRLR